MEDCRPDILPVGTSKDNHGRQAEPWGWVGLADRPALSLIKLGPRARHPASKDFRLRRAWTGRQMEGNEGSGRLPGRCPARGAAGARRRLAQEGRREASICIEVQVHSGRSRGAICGPQNHTHVVNHALNFLVGPLVWPAVSPCPCPGTPKPLPCPFHNIFVLMKYTSWESYPSPHL